MKKGIAASKGYAIGKVFLQEHEEIVITDTKVSDVEAEKEVLNKALEQAKVQLSAIRDKALKEKPKMIIAGASAYSRIIDFKKFREIADSVGAYLMVDMAHIAGLVAAGLHPSPVPYADVVTTTTHKALRGPRGGMILCREELAKQIISKITKLFILS